jgi:hypothetical protein
MSATCPVIDSGNAFLGGALAAPHADRLRRKAFEHALQPAAMTTGTPWLLPGGKRPSLSDLAMSQMCQEQSFRRKLL